jgi:hypothetical protein
VVPFPCESRGRPPWRVRKGKSPAKRLLKAPILLKADVSELDEGWSDGEIIKALNTNAPLVYLVRKQLVEDGFEAALSRKQRTTPATPRIFDGEKEAGLIALACSTPPKGYGRWTLRLLEKKVVERKPRKTRSPGYMATKPSTYHERRPAISWRNCCGALIRYVVARARSRGKSSGLAFIVQPGQPHLMQSRPASV